MQEFVDRSSILVLASHSDALIRSWCNRAALFEAGQMLRFGEVDEVIEAYHGRQQPAQMAAAAE
jgi:ABC-2 type transport system ATP-binding protein/lipopolysaccharide transport system ATP-binding protein